MLAGNTLKSCLSAGFEISMTLVLEHTVWCLQTVQVFVMFNMFYVRFWAKMWCSESSMFRHSMFGLFEVQYFGVRCKTTTYLWQDINSVSVVLWCECAHRPFFQNCLHKSRKSHTIPVENPIKKSWLFSSTFYPVSFWELPTINIYSYLVCQL